MEIYKRLKMTDEGLLASCLSKNIDLDTLSQREIINIYKAMKDFAEIQIIKQLKQLKQTK